MFHWFNASYPAWAGRPSARNATLYVSDKSVDVVTFGFFRGKPHVKFTGFEYEEGVDGAAMRQLAEAMRLMINHVTSKSTGLRLRTVHSGIVDAANMREYREVSAGGTIYDVLKMPIQHRAPEAKRLYITAKVWSGGAVVTVPPMLFEVNQSNVAYMAQFEFICGKVADWVMDNKKKAR